MHRLLNPCSESILGPGALLIQEKLKLTHCAEKGVGLSAVILTASNCNDLMMAKLMAAKFMTLILVKGLRSFKPWEQWLLSTSSLQLEALNLKQVIVLDSSNSLIQVAIIQFIGLVDKWETTDS
eukprot:c9797_g1_i1.p1 GENE.c9797_g1_i1~~c9797_g1_i1.p1  ORF type:complete len:124 (+),score=25.22 c9797_g1_i1:57-428(+)